LWKSFAEQTDNKVQELLLLIAEKSGLEADK
jgi:hypothetical protein